MDAVRTAVIEDKSCPKKEHLGLCWRDSPAVQGLLDVISVILATEYVRVAKQNPETFKSSVVSR